MKIQKKIFFFFFFFFGGGGGGSGWGFRVDVNRSKVFVKIRKKNLRVGGGVGGSG